jgi:predicted HicB family RNase H-like nuclease
MRLMQYKGYVGGIEANVDDAVLHGKLEFINALVTFEGETVALVKQAFEQAVDDYLADCAQLGYTPEVPCKGVFNVRVGHELHLKAAITAREMGVSLNDLVGRGIEQITGSQTTV